MTSPLQIYRFADSILPQSSFSSCEVVAGSAANLTNHHPGKPIKLGTAFEVFDGSKAPPNNQIRVYRPGAGSAVGNIPAGGYSADELCTAIEGLTSVALVIGGTTCTYDYDTRKFTIESSPGFPFYIQWQQTAEAQACADLLGFEAVQTAFLSSHTGGNSVYVDDSHWIGWIVGDASSGGISDRFIERVMIYDTNLASSDGVQIFGHGSWLGERPADWAGAAYVGDFQLATNSRSNDIYLWESQVRLAYLVAFFHRGGNPNQGTMDPCRVGCVGVWRSNNFDGADYSRTIRSAVTSRRVVRDTATSAHAGGNLEIGTVRGYREMLLGIGAWDETTYYALDTYLDKYRVDPALWLVDPDDIATDNGLFGYVPPGEWGDVSWRGPQHVRDLTLGVRGVPMSNEV